MFSKIKSISYHDINGLLESVQPLEAISLKTNVGLLTPIYEVEDHGRQKLSPVKFCSKGLIKTINLQNSTKVETSIGKISTELITFYPEGQIRRLFPLNGKLSGYWSENDEYKLAESIDIKTPLGIINAKPIYFHYYKTGELKSVTFWPKEKIILKTHIGDIEIKTGVSFYKSGKLHSLEPANPITIETPIGRIKAFDPDPIGVNGEKNSLSFHEDGTIERISTIATKVKVNDLEFSPSEVPSLCNDDEFMLLPLKIEFEPETYKFKINYKLIGESKPSDNHKITSFVSKKKLFGIASCT